MNNHSEFVSLVYKNLPTQGSITCSSPSNIALVKYWGKRDVQLPENPSISFTLSNCVTKTVVRYIKLDQAQQSVNFELLFEGQEKPEFRPKIASFFQRILPYMPFLEQYKLFIDTQNTFPHSSGIASSASGMSALAFALVQLEKEINQELSAAFLLKKASFLARLGSGSACRSIEGPVTMWGKHQSISESSDDFAISVPFKVHKKFNSYQDVILLIDKGEKQVSSTVGHNLMHNHPFAQKRFEQAHNNIDTLIEILKTGDLDRFITLVESEALTLHAMMMTSLPYFILMKPNTLLVLQKVWNYRNATGSKLCFTLDAGANVHLLFPENEKDEIYNFIKNELVVYCDKGQYICDKLGLGAKIV
ncbi:diphosphomevalonate/mevalonate 3,5-bisphosphate decarboxylase family protein [Aquimarina sp. W85]|uniref:diphosphomevalonate/mevalonate 3,5-bisphosphate decarboxylase family protein n=1 Tax=Aquimarina rhodophyticola TaxID=3342246 RepID=UPI0036705B7D